MITANFSSYQEVKSGLPKSNPFTNISWTWLPVPVGSGFRILFPGYTHNGWRGCNKVSPACSNCYAESTAKRNPGTLGEWGTAAVRTIAAETYWKLPYRWNADAAALGDHMRRGVFSLSMGDVFEDYAGPAENIRDHRGVSVPGLSDHDDPLTPFRARLLGTIMETQHLIWMLLTKRPHNIMRMLQEIAEMAEGEPLGQWLNQWIGGKPPRNVWIGATVENQDWFDRRKESLFSVPARTHMLSMEPLLGPVDLGKLPDSAWVIAGGESGPGFREESANLENYESLRDQCESLHVPFFMKQVAGFRPQDEQIPENLKIRQYPDL